MVVGSSVLVSEDGREGGDACRLLEAYEGKSLLITGATGFLGTALVEKILWCLLTAFFIDVDLLAGTRSVRRTPLHPGPSP
jgi:hypothetical protein